MKYFNININSVQQNNYSKKAFLLKELYRSCSKCNTCSSNQPEKNPADLFKVSKITQNNVKFQSYCSDLQQVCAHRESLNEFSKVISLTKKGEGGIFQRRLRKLLYVLYSKDWQIS